VSLDALLCFSPLSVSPFSFFMIPPPPPSTLFPYTTLFRSPSWLVGKIHFFDCLPAREKFFKVGFFSKKARSYSPMNMGARGHFCDSKHKRYLGTKYRACHYRESMI